MLMKKNNVALISPKSSIIAHIVLHVANELHVLILSLEQQIQLSHYISIEWLVSMGEMDTFLLWLHK